MTPDQPRRPAQPNQKPTPTPPEKSASPTAARPGSAQPQQGQRQPSPPPEQKKPQQKKPASQPRKAQQKKPPSQPRKARQKQPGQARQKQPGEAQKKQPGEAQKSGRGTGRQTAQGSAPSRRAQATAAQPDPAPRGRTAEQAQRATSGAQAAATGGIAQATGGQRPAQKKQRTQQKSTRQRVVPVRVQGDRRYRQRITHIDMWSAAKVTTCFYLSALIVMLIAGVVLWSIASAAGAIGNIEEFMQDAGFEDFRFLSGQIIRGGVLVGLAFVAIAEVLTLVAVGLYNLFAELIGGLEVTVREESRDQGR